jgi:hypothetical protein
MMAKKKQHEWNVFILRAKAKFIGYVEAPDREAAIAAAIKKFEIKDPEQQRRVSVERVSD